MDPLIPGGSVNSAAFIETFGGFLVASCFDGLTLDFSRGGSGF